MKIMLDLDKVVLNCPSLLSSIGNLIFTDSYQNRKLTYKEIPADTTMDYFNLMFFAKMSHKENYVPVENSIDIIKKWQSEGHEIHFVSSRPNIKSFYKPIIQWLKDNNIDFSKIVIACSNKAIYGKLNHFDVMVDDNLKNCICANRLGLKSIWLKTRTNQPTKPEEIDGKIICVQSWNALDNYIQSLSKTKGRLL